MNDTIKGFRGKDGPILLDYSGVANVPGAVKSIGELTAAVGDHFEVAAVDESGRISEVTAVEKPGGGSGQNVALSTAQINALDGMFRVCAYDDSKDVSGAYAAFKTAFGIAGEPGEEEDPDTPVTPEKTLTGISAVYSGGDVPVGTAVSELTGVVVTAHYSDGSTETVTGYTLSGEIAEGGNTITASYEGKTTTFTVTGVAESAETVVEMGSWGACGDYQHNGGAMYADDGTSGETVSFGSGASTAMLSDMVFEADTKVNVALTWESSGYDSFAVGSSNSDTVSKKIVMYHAIKAGRETQVYTGTTTEIAYTVKAGYRLAIMARNGFTGSVKVTAAEV